MNKFEKQIINLNRESLKNINEDQFISKLYDRLDEAKKNKINFIYSFSLIFLIGFFSMTQIGVYSDNEIYSSHIDEQYYFETDLWNLNTDSLYVNDDYTEDLVYFLSDEGSIIDVFEILNNLELIEEGVAL
tara:strand:- start:775 stop:1167 length:393 start_codon:yes stop_codon:yes gene_type:complete